MQMPKTNTLVLVVPPRIDSFLTSLITSIAGISEYLVIMIAFLTSIIGWQHYFDLNLVLSYNDAMSHLDISRRVVENLKPGIAQIGSVWLPLPHLLSLPFIWNDFLWHSGLAGSIVSNLAFIGSAFFIFKLTSLLTKDKLAAFLSALVFIFNPNMVYMQAVPMTESLLIFLFVGSCYYFLAWEKTADFRALILASLMVLGATLTRYDGWMLLLQALIVLVVIAWHQGGFKKIESRLVLFGAIAFYGVILWFIWNLLIFGDPLYFFNGPFSAKTQQLVFESEGRLSTKGNIIYSAFIYSLAAIKNNGMIMTFISAIGIFAYFLKNKFSKEAFAVSLLLSPLIFNVAALFLGHSIINLPDIAPYTLFNVRYGLMMLPAVAIFAGYLAKNKKLLLLVFLFALSLETIFAYKNNDIITVKDGIYGASAQGMTATGHWLGEHANEGLILIAASSQDSLIFQTGLPMKRFIHEGTGEYWKESLEDPTSHATWIAMHHGDLVYNKLFDNPAFQNSYEKVYDGEFTDIFEYNPSPAKRLTIKDLP